MAGLGKIDFKRFLRDNLAIVLQVAAVALIVISFFFGRTSDYTDAASRSLSSRLASRLQVLDSYIEDAATDSRDKWMELEGLPEDMVIYRYRGDTLQAWSHQFPVADDDINRRGLFRLAPNLSNAWDLPLSSIDTVYSFRNIGTKWYILRYADAAGSSRIIGGLEVKNTVGASTVNGVNKRLKLSDRFSVYPLTYSGGAEVSVNGIPMLKVIQENAQALPLVPDTTAAWMAVFIMILGAFIYLYTHRTMKGLIVSQVWILIILGCFYFVGKILSASTEIFSPAVYADGSVFYSLGAVFIINTAICAIVYSLYSVRIPLARRLGGLGERAFLVWGLLIAAVPAIALYSYFSFKSIIVNSNISLELFKIGQISLYSVFVYISYIFLFCSCVLLLQLLRPFMARFFRLRVNFLSPVGRLGAIIVCSVFLVTVSALEGLKREESKVNIWANRLAIERNLSFELQLLAVENAIASDAFIGGLAAEKKDYRIILNRITENYLGRLAQNYDLGIYIFNDNEGEATVLSYLSDRLSSGSPISDKSRFVYSRSAQGRAQYTGRFSYYSRNGITNLVLTIEAKSEKDDIGYYAVLGNSSPGSIVLPHIYSYAKYLNDKLIGYKGNYAYPTVLKGLFKEYDNTDAVSRISYDGYEHFFRKIADDELIIISRRVVEFTSYLVAAFLVSLTLLLLLSLISIDRRRRSAFSKNYYKSTFNTVLFASLVGTMVVLALISVVFVYRRNETNINNLMTSKISTIQALLQSEIRYYNSIEDFDSQAAAQMLSAIGDHTKSDLTLYTTTGRVFKSTRPEMFERMLLGLRVDQEAYKNIMYENKRYYIHKESVAGRYYYAMYAPLSNREGKILAILCAPYTDTGLEFRTEAVFHSLFIITLFFILLILARFTTSRFVDRMFSPLLYMGRKMIAARSEGLEYIIYDRDDEISTLVRAYNLMVHDLSESSRQLARAERDKAWSEMARQVAHEIKNPLTPIKLQIQRLIMLRSRGDASWGERFDAMAPVILESIDTLTDTANEFSTFAKLYSEEPVEIDLDRLIREQIALFDDKTDIDFQYFSLQGAVIQGPKPQITRVLVNLLSNAVQATSSKVYVSLRKSSREGFYEVVVEDNGPGVKDENRSRLFTPNFTTKSSGTGLGLAICKNILERCGGDITYSRSFSLGGASFTVFLKI